MTRRLTSSTSAVCLVMAALVLTVAASSPAAPILPPLKFARAVTEVHRGRCEAVLDDLHALSEGPDRQEGAHPICWRIACSSAAT